MHKLKSNSENKETEPRQNQNGKRIQTGKANEQHKTSKNGDDEDQARKRTQGSARQKS